MCGWLLNSLMFTIAHFCEYSQFMFIYVDEKLKLPGQVSKTPVGLKCSVGEVCDTVAEFTPFGRVGEG